MICTNKSMFDIALKEYKNSDFYLIYLIDTLRFGSPSIGVKKDVKKAIDILHYAEKHFDIKKNNYIINYKLHELYKDLGKDKLAKEYLGKYYVFESEFKNNNSSIRELLSLDFNKAYNRKKDRLDDKKIIPNAIKQLEELVFNSTKDLDFYFNNQPYFNALINLLSEGEYKKLYLVHILKGEYSYYHSISSCNLVKSFTKDDFTNYFKAFDKKEYEKYKDFMSDLKLYYEYNFTDCSDEIKIKYSKAISIEKYYFLHDYSLAEKILLDLYESGNKKAVSHIIKYYEFRNNRNDLIKFLEGYVKKYKTDKSYKIYLADLYFKVAMYNGTVYEKTKFNKALKIYEENSELLCTEQLKFLSEIYAKGIGVTKDLEKAKSYSKSNESSKLIIEEEIKDFGKSLKLKDSYFKDMIDNLLLGFNELNNEKLETLFDVISDGYIVEKDPKLLFQLATFMANNNMTEGLGKLYICYVFGIGVEENIDKARNLMEEIIKREDGFAYYCRFIHYADTLKKPEEALTYLYKSVEMNYIHATVQLAKMYYDGVIVPKDLQKSYDLYKSAYLSGKYCNINLYPILYSDNKYDSFDLDTYFEILKNVADLTNHPIICKKVYFCNKEVNKLKEKEALNYLIRSAVNNEVAAINELINLYNNSNQKECYKWILKGVELGHVRSVLIQAGYFYYGDKGLNIKQDYNQAFKLFNSIKEKNNRAKYMLGRCYYYGNGTKENYKKAFECLKEAYESDVKEASTYLGYCYKDGNGVAQDYEKAYKLIKEGSSLGGYYMGRYASIYHYGLGDYLEVDLNKAVKLYKEALKTNKTDSEYNNLGNVYYQLEDFNNALNCYEEALKINSKYIPAIKNIALVYKNSYNLEKDYNKAIEYYEKALVLNDKEANLKIAEIYIYENYGFTDFKKALPYLLEAYKDKIKGADVLLAYSYQHTGDEKKAYEIAKDIKEESVLLNCVLGNLHYSGKFLPTDYAKAFNYYQKAYNKDKDDPYIWFRLGKCYYFGHGVERDKNRAYDFIKMSIEKGFTDAQNFYNDYFVDRN